MPNIYQRSITFGHCVRNIVSQLCSERYNGPLYCEAELSERDVEGLERGCPAAAGADAGFDVEVDGMLGTVS